MMQMHSHPHLQADDAPHTEGRTIRWSQHYDLLVKLLTFGRDTALRKETLRLAALPSDATVLDVGCGTGSLTLFAEQELGHGGKVYGIDASPEMIAVAHLKAIRQRQDVHFRVAAIESLPYPDAMFDVVLSSLMFHHLPGSLKERALVEVARVLKPGGRLFIVDMKRPEGFFQRFDTAIMVHRGMNSGVQDLVPLLEKTGYRAVRAGNMKWRSLGFVEGRRDERV